MKLDFEMTNNSHVEADEVNHHNHPSVLERKKLEAARKQRLTKALRNNLQKRKEQMRARLVESAS